MAQSFLGVPLDRQLKRTDVDVHSTFRSTLRWMFRFAFNAGFGWQ